MLVLVGVVTVVVAVSAVAGRLVVHALLPGVPLAACFALGAVVAPPDAVSATAVARRIGLPRRIVSILEGESLVNDATALVIFRVAVAAAVGQTLSVPGVVENAVRASVGGVLNAPVGDMLLAQRHSKRPIPLVDNAVSL